MSNINPKLRFKEFTKPVKKVKFGDISKVNQGLQIPIAERFLQPVEGGQFYITNEFLKAGSNKCYYIQNPPASVICNEEDILMTRTGNTGQVVTDVSGAFHNNFFRIGFDRDKFYKSFLVQYLRTTKTQNHILKLAGISTIPDLNHSDFYRIPIPYFEFDEQKKIADFLTSVDTKISQLAEKHRLLKKYKKGVMQQIFGQLLCFKDENGNAFPEWEEKPLNQLASKVTTKNKSRLVKAVLTNSAKHGIISQQDYFDKEIAKEDNTDNYYVVDINDFVYNPRISELAPVGPIGRNNVEQGVMSPLYSVFRFKPEVCLDFIAYFFKGTAWHKYMHSVANFGARHDRMNISSADLMALPCPFPCIEEQKKIAQFLQSIDTKIEGVAEQVEQTKQFKKGLLQQMFV